MTTCAGLKIKPVSFGGGLRPYELAFPVPLYKLDKNRGRLSERIQINPDAFTHKDYPTCKGCTTKFVPVEKGDTICFKCKILHGI